MEMISTFLLEATCIMECKLRNQIEFSGSLFIFMCCFVSWASLSNPLSQLDTVLCAHKQLAVSCLSNASTPASTAVLQHYLLYILGPTARTSQLVSAPVYNALELPSIFKVFVSASMESISVGLCQKGLALIYESTFFFNLYEKFKIKNHLFLTKRKYINGLFVMVVIKIHDLE